MATIRKITAQSGKTCWQVRFIDADGHRVARNYRSKKEAATARLEIENKLAERHAVAGVPVSDAIASWLDFFEAKTKAEHRSLVTLYGYKRTLKHLTDHKIMRIKTGDLSRADILSLKNHLELHKGISLDQASRILARLSQALSHAIDQGWLAQNPAKGVTIDRRARGEEAARAHRGKKPPATPADIAAIKCAAAAKPDGGRMSAMIALMAHCGLRIGEVLAMPISGVDFDGRKITISQALDRTGRIKTPKSTAGRRQIPFGPATASALNLWIKNRPSTPADLLFPAPRTKGPIDYHNWHSRHWRALAKDAGRPNLEPHQLRHTFAWAMISAGAGAKELQQLMGHSTITLTLDTYGGFWRDVESAARNATAVEVMLGEQPLDKTGTD